MDKIFETLKEGYILQFEKDTTISYKLPQKFINDTFSNKLKRYSIKIGQKYFFNFDNERLEKVYNKIYETIKSYFDINLIESKIKSCVNESVPEEILEPEIFEIPEDSKFIVTGFEYKDRDDKIALTHNLFYSYENYDPTHYGSMLYESGDYLVTMKLLNDDGSYNHEAKDVYIWFKWLYIHYSDRDIPKFKIINKLKRYYK